MQILFPEPQIKRLRAIAGSQDRPVSELIRAAVDLWLARQGPQVEMVAEPPPSYHCGRIMVAAEDLRERAMDDGIGS